MEKVLTIDGKEVLFRSTGAFLLRYKAQFGRDAIQDIYKVHGAVDGNGNVKDISVLDLEVFYDLIWTLAKTADPEIPPPMEWLDSFGEFPLMDILPELFDLIFSSLAGMAQSKKK